MKRKMNDGQYWKIGRTVTPMLETYCTLEEIGRQFGWTKQLAVYHSNVAIGKVIYGLRKELLNGSREDFLSKH